MARRTLPHNLDAEASILGGVLVDNSTLDLLPDLETDDFYALAHKVVWSAMRNLEAAKKPIDIVTLEVEIDRQGKLDAIGGVSYLGELALRVPTPDNVASYRDSVRLLSRNRRAIVELSQALESALTWQHDPAEMISEIAGTLSRLDNLASPERQFRLFTIADAMEDLAQNFAGAPVFDTPFETINAAIGMGGLVGTQVYTLNAGTGRGKTSFVAQVAAHVASYAPVLVASYEMRPGYFVARASAGRLGTHSNAILRCEVRVGDVLAALPYPRLLLLHKPSLRDLRAATSYVAKKYGSPPLIIVDYLQKMADEIAFTMARPDLRFATSQASAGLCELAEKTGAAVLAVSAVGRGKGKIMTNPRDFGPYDLVEVAKESGAVEYDGAGVIVLNLSSEYEGDEQVATMTVAKARFGSAVHVEARYHGARGYWRDLGRVDRDEGGATAPLESKIELHAKILRALVGNPARSKNALYERVKGNKVAVNEAIDRMHAAGDLTAEASGNRLANITITDQGLAQIQSGTDHV